MTRPVRRVGRIIWIIAGMSKYERWLPTRMAGPVRGMFSVPATSKRAYG